MKKFFIITSVNEKNKLDSVSKTKNEIIRALKKIEGTEIGFHDGFLDRDFRVPRGVECVITVGGDGTMLRAARAAFGGSVRFIGINRGHMGYLTELSELSDYDAFAKRLVNDDYRIQERMMLSAKAERRGKIFYRDYAINDVLLSQNNSVKMMDFEVYIGETLLNSYKADGFVVASPTGSTAYSMSAGGPIASPTAKLLILTPICPHSINTRSMVLSADDKITVVPHAHSQVVSCDGGSPTELLDGDKLIVTRARTSMKFIKFAETSFLDTLRDRMRVV